MEVNLATFSTRQQQALLDLLILARYADGHLSTASDEQLQKILVAMGHTDEIQRQREFDSAVIRMQPFVQSIRQAKEKALALAGMFHPRIQQRQVLEAVEHFMTSDSHVSSWECALLSELRMKFRM